MEVRGDVDYLGQRLEYLGFSSFRSGTDGIWSAAW